MEQNLVNAVVEQIRQGKDYFDIHKAMMNTNYKNKEINNAIRLIRIVGVENADENLLLNIKKDKLFVKKSSKLGIYFNIAILTLLFSLILRVVGLIFGTATSTLALGIIIFQIILLVVAIVGMYFASDWGLTVYSVMLVMSIYGLFTGFSSNGITYLTLIDIFLIVVNLFCFIKIMKKFTWKTGLKT